MNNAYPAPCRYCGGTVAPADGTLEKIGQSFQVVHANCRSEMDRQFMSLLSITPAQRGKRRMPPP